MTVERSGLNWRLLTVKLLRGASTLFPKMIWGSGNEVAFSDSYLETRLDIGSCAITFARFVSNL